MLPETLFIIHIRLPGFVIGTTTSVSPGIKYHNTTPSVWISIRLLFYFTSSPRSPGLFMNTDYRGNLCTWAVNLKMPPLPSHIFTCRCRAAAHMPISCAACRREYSLRFHVGLSPLFSLYPFCSSSISWKLQAYHCITTLAPPAPPSPPSPLAPVTLLAPITS
jgi:hypothetical protein